MRRSPRSIVCAVNWAVWPVLLGRLTHTALDDARLTDGILAANKVRRALARVAN